MASITIRNLEDGLKTRVCRSAGVAELNPAENVWQFPRRNKLSNLIFNDSEAIVTNHCVTPVMRGACLTRVAVDPRLCRGTNFGLRPPSGENHER